MSTTLGEAAAASVGVEVRAGDGGTDGNLGKAPRVVTRRRRARSRSRSWSPQRAGMHGRQGSFRGENRRGGYSRRDNGGRGPYNSPRGRRNSHDDGMTMDQRAEKLAKEELTRSLRTVCVSQLQIKTTRADLAKFFRSVCGVNHVELLRDRATDRPKGIAYVEVKTVEDIARALTLDGMRFIFRNGHKGFPIKVTFSEAEKNYARSVEKLHRQLHDRAIQREERMQARVLRL